MSHPDPDGAGQGFGIDSLVDPESKPRAASAPRWRATGASDSADGRPVRRDLHWWLGGALLAVALPMLLWQAVGESGQGKPVDASSQGRREPAQVRPPETTSALERTIDDQARLAQLPQLPPLPAMALEAARGGPLVPLPPRMPGSDVLERRRHDPAAASLPASLPVAETSPTRAERLAAEQERRDADARSSPLLAIGQGGGGMQSVQARPHRSLLEPAYGARPDAASAPAAAPAALPSGAQPVMEQSMAAPPSAALRRAPEGPAVLEGTVIPAVLLTEINSELPGTLVAMVTQDIWDSVHGRHLLIPKGSRLVGDYNSDVRPGQERVLAAFRRLIFPNGSSLDLLGMQATDAQGRSGLNDRVDHHFWTMFGASFIVAGLASLVQRRESQPATVIVVPGGAPAASSALASAAGTVLVETSRAMLGRTRNMPPTLVIRQGHRFSLTVQRNFLLDPINTGNIAEVSR